jgi:hypothetical protein
VSGRQWPTVSREWVACGRLAFKCLVSSGQQLVGSGHSALECLDGSGQPCLESGWLVDAWHLSAWSAVVNSWWAVDTRDDGASGRQWPQKMLEWLARCAVSDMNKNLGYPGMASRGSRSIVKWAGQECSGLHRGEPGVPKAAATGALEALGLAEQESSGLHPREPGVPKAAATGAM